MRISTMTPDSAIRMSATTLTILLPVMMAIPIARAHFVVQEVETFDGTEKDPATWEEYAPLHATIHQDDALIFDMVGAAVSDCTTTKVTVGLGETVRVRLLERPAGRAEVWLLLTTNSEGTDASTRTDSLAFYINHAALPLIERYYFAGGFLAEGGWKGTSFGADAPSPSPGKPVTLEIHRLCATTAICTAYDSNMVPIGSVCTPSLPHPGITDELYVSLMVHTEDGGRTVFDDVVIVRSRPRAPATMNTLAGWTGATFDAFGETPADPASQDLVAFTVGQTFRIAGEGRFSLDEISFPIDDLYPDGPAAEACMFEVFVTPWTGTRPVDDILYRSEPLTTAGLAEAETFTLRPEEVVLSGETSYIVFLTAGHFLNGVRSDASVGIVDNVYPAGEFYRHAGPASADLFDRLFTEDWSSDLACQQDLALHLEWSPLADVPDP